MRKREAFSNISLKEKSRQLIRVRSNEVLNSQSEEEKLRHEKGGRSWEACSNKITKGPIQSGKTCKVKGGTQQPTQERWNTGNKEERGKAKKHQLMKR